MQPEEFSKAIEAAYKKALEGVDKINADAEQIRARAEEELEAARAIRRQAEAEADAFFERHLAQRQAAYQSAAQDALRRELILLHLQNKEKMADIEKWLGVTAQFIRKLKTQWERSGQIHPAQALPGTPRLRYSDMGRGGTVYFENGDIRFDLWWEFAGGDALVVLEVPTEKEWEQRTRLPLQQRADVLDFIGRQVVADKIGGNGYFVVGENAMTFYAQS